MHIRRLQKGRQDKLLQLYPLMPDCATPSINCFWKIKNTRITGMTAITAPAICMGYCVVNCPCKVERAGPKIMFLGEVLTISGHIKSFQANLKVKILKVTRPGFTSGNMILPKI